MSRYQIKLKGEEQRALGHRWLDAAPLEMLIIFQDPTRTLEQNAKMWAMLGDISKQHMRNGVYKSSEVWKSLFMHSLGHEMKFEMGLNGEIFPTGFKSSQLGIKQMNELIEWMYKWGAENKIVWNEARKGGWLN